MKGNIHILSLYDVILLIPNPPVFSRLTLHNFKSSILLYTTNAHDQDTYALDDMSYRYILTSHECNFHGHYDNKSMVQTDERETFIIYTI